MQGGFGQRTTPSEGVLDPVLAKALYLESDRSRVRHGEALLLITADLIAIPHQVSAPVVAAIVAASSLAPHQICVCASHTHSGPLPYGAPDAPGVARYSEFLIAALIEVGLEAVAHPVACEVGTGTGSVDVFFNRRTVGTRTSSTRESACWSSRRPKAHVNARCCSASAAIRSPSAGTTR